MTHRAPADVVLFARSQWRHKWRGLMVLSLLVTLVATVVLASATGARRSPGAYERLRDETHAADLQVLTSSLPTPATLGRIEQIDGVARAEVQPMLWVRPVGSDLYPGYHSYSVPVSWQSTTPLNRPIVMSGRAPRDEAANEIAMNSHMADVVGLDIGEHVTLESMTQPELAIANAGGESAIDGPHVDATLVAIVKAPIEFGRFRDVMYLTPAFLAEYDAVAIEGGLEVAVEDPARAPEHSFTAELAAAVTAPDGGGGAVGPAGEATRASLFGPNDDASAALRMIARTLWIVVAVSAFAGAIAIALVTLRSSRSAIAEGDVLMTLGWTERRRTLAVLLTLGPWLAAGVALALPTTILASPLAMFGLAALVDPSPGAHVLDGWVLTVGGASILVLVGLVALGSSSIAAKSQLPRRASRPAWMRLGQPLVVRLGIRHAFGAAGGPARRSSRTALVAAVVTVASVVMALTIASSISRLQSDASLSGGDETSLSVGGESLESLLAALPILEADPRVTTIYRDAIVFGARAVEHPDSDLVIFSFEMLRGTFNSRLPQGVIPRQPDEVALGPALLDRFGVSIGDEIELVVADTEASYRIVGSALLPDGDVKFDEGVAMTFEGSDRLIGSTADDVELIHEAGFELAPGIDADAAVADLRAKGLEIFLPGDATLPASVANLGEVTSVPRWLGLFVGVLGATAVGHGLVVGGRLRRRELGVLRALGLSTADGLAAVAVQGICIAVVAIIVGVPMGFFGGRQLWTRIAEGAHVVVETVLPWGQVGVVTLVAALSVLLICSVPGWSVLRLTPTEELRNE